MKTATSDFSSPVESLRNASDDGQLAARLFLQSLIDNGDVMDGKEAGEAFGNVAIDEFRAFIGDENKEAGLARMSSFLCFIGEVLWQQTEPQRQAVAQVFDTPKPRSMSTRVIRIVKVAP